MINFDDLTLDEMMDRVDLSEYLELESHLILQDFAYIHQSVFNIVYQMREEYENND